jgi:hypothetical protein
VGEPRLQRLRGDGGARCEVVGLVQALARLTFGDPQPGGQHIGPGLAAQIDGAGLAGELMRQPVIHSGLTAISAFQPILDAQNFGRRQRREGQPGHLGLHSVPPIESGHHGLPIRAAVRKHVRMISRPGDNNRKLSTGKTKVTQVN